jgi:hypothetical protein
VGMRIKVKKVGAQKMKRIEIEMYWEERKLYCEVKMTYILGKFEIAKMTYIVERGE